MYIYPSCMHFSEIHWEDPKEDPGPCDAIFPLENATALLLKDIRQYKQKLEWKII